MAGISPRVLAAFLAMATLHADSKKLTMDQRVELLRGLTAEYAKAKAPLPRSKKPLEFDSHGNWDAQKWSQIGRDQGEAARIGDIVKVTSIDIGKDRIVLELNGGMKGTGHWYDHVEAGMGGGMQPINGQKQSVEEPKGTYIALLFDGPIGEITSAEVKKMLAPVLDFDKTSATENYMDTVPPEIKQAITDKKPVEGMDRDQLILALGHPLRKIRESKDGTDYEDWIYGQPPGRVTFVTFAGDKVVRIKDTYAGLGGSVAETPAPQ